MPLPPGWSRRWISWRTEPAAEGAAFLDEIVMHEVLSEIKDIAATGRHLLRLRQPGSGRFQVNYSSVDLICAQCGAQMRIPAATADDIDDICCKTYHVDPGKK